MNNPNTFFRNQPELKMICAQHAVFKNYIQQTEPASG